MPRGGRRVGAGRKPKADVLRFIDGNAGHRTQPGRQDAAPAPGTPAPVNPPADLPADELAVWNEWAPRAIEQRTLTANMVYAFVHLCQMEVDRRQLRARFTQRREQPFLGESEMWSRREHRALVHEINARLKDFCLSPLGKEVFPSGGAGVSAPDPLVHFIRRR